MDAPATLAPLGEIDANIGCCFLSGDPGKYAPDELWRMGGAHLFRKPLTDWGLLAQALLDMAMGAWCHSG